MVCAPSIALSTRVVHLDTNWAIRQLKTIVFFVVLLNRRGARQSAAGESPAEGWLAR